MPRKYEYAYDRPSGVMTTTTLPSTALGSLIGISFQSRRRPVATSSSKTRTGKWVGL